MKSLNAAHQNRMRLFWLSTATTFLFSTIGVYTVLSQGSSRKIVSDGFVDKRPTTASAVSGGRITDPVATPKGSGNSSGRPKPKNTKTATKKPRHTYRLASPPAAKPSQANSTAQLGITIWRLRLAKASDTGARQLVRVNNQRSEWVPERIEADTLIREGDRIRITIESPTSGYLYIADRDLFSGDEAGETKLIFPIQGDDNRVNAGRLIDIPTQDGEASYFTAHPKPNQTGEVLTIIVTTSPLSLPLSNTELPISVSQLAEWERMWGGATERFEMEGGAGEAWTQEEKEAAKKGTRQLTRDDPPPQTIYRVSAADVNAFLVNVRLRYSR